MLLRATSRPLQQAVRALSSQSHSSIYAVQLQQELALRHITLGGQVSIPLCQPTKLHAIPGPEQPFCESDGSRMEVSWERDQFANGYSLRHLGKSTHHSWVEITDLQFSDENIVAHTVEVSPCDSHLVQIRAHFGDFETEWSDVRVTQTGFPK